MNEAVYDGFVSRHLNRRISRPLARVLAHTPATPNQVSIASLGMALAGTFTVTYTRARIDVQTARPFERGITSAASRDVRLLMVMVGGLLGQGLLTLVVLAVLTNTVVLLRLLAARRILK